MGSENMLQALQRYLQRVGISEEMLARKLGKNLDYVEAVLAGPDIGLLFLDEICGALGIQPADLQEPH